MKISEIILVFSLVIGCGDKTTSPKPDDDEPSKTRTSDSAKRSASAAPSSAQTSAPTNAPSAVVSSAASADPLASYVDFKSDAGKFTAKFPTKPEEKTSQVPTPAGNAEQHMFVSASATGAYMAGYSDYPKGTQFDRKKALDGAREGMVQAVGATNVVTKNIKIEGQDGYDVTFDAPSVGPGVARYFLVGSRLYMLVTIGVGKEASEPFFGAFKLTK